MQTITFVSTGGTIDKVYFDASSEFEVGESVVEHVLREALIDFEYQQIPLMRKDSLDMTDADRQAVVDCVLGIDGRQVIITHGSDTMVETAQALQVITDKAIVLTGSLAPARFKTTDAVFNVGLSVGAVQSLPNGIYVAMSGQVFTVDNVRKNKQRQRFERLR